MTLEQYCHDSIFAPLGMYETSWFLAGFEDTDNIAMPYSYTGGAYVPHGHYGVPAYPSAQLRTSSLQLAEFLRCLMRRGSLEAGSLLDSATVDSMLTVQYPLLPQLGDWVWGLFWYNRLVGSRSVWGHSGGGPGIATFMFFNPEENTGVIVLTNGESHTSVDLIAEALFEFAATQTDSDGDGMFDVTDNCPLAYNPGQGDADSDGFGDSCDVCIFDAANDEDADGVCGDVDNCPFETNADQADNNGDGVGNACCCGYYSNGWTGNANCSSDGMLTLSDVTRLVDYVYISKEPLCCEASGNTNGSSDHKTTLSDVTRLIDHIFVSRTPTASCP